MQRVALQQPCLAGCFLSFSLILLSLNAGLFCWARLGSRRRQAKVDCRAAEVMKSSAVFTHRLVIRPSFFPLGGRGHSLTRTDSHKHAHTVKLEGKEENSGHRWTTSYSFEKKLCVDSSQTHGAPERADTAGLYHKCDSPPNKLTEHLVTT